MNLELVTAQSTASATTGTAATALTGDTLLVRAGRGKINIVSAWSSANTNVLTSQLVFPSAHDTTRGIRAVVPAGPIATANSGALILPLGVSVPVDAQETIVVTHFASAVAGDVDNTSMLISYDDFPGISGRYISAEELDRRRDKVTTIVSTVTDAGAGVYSEEVITVDSDLLRANRDYALVGISSATAAHAFTFLTPDNGNTRVGVPGNLRQEVTAQWFSLMARAHGEKFVPIFNSGNKAAIKLGFVGDENAGNRTLTAHLVLLK